MRRAYQSFLRFLKNPENRPLLVLLAVLAVSRLILQFTLRASTFADSYEYQGLAHMLRTGNFAGFMGQRSPGYPFLILAVGENLRALYIVQALLGIGTAVLAYFLTRRLTGKGWLSCAAGLVVGLHPKLLLYEAIIGTETLSLFLVTASAYLLAAMLDPRTTRRQSYVYAWLQGTLSVWMILTRPALTVIPLVIALILWLVRRRKSALLYLGLTVLTVLGWSAANYRLGGFFGMTSWQGYNLMRPASGWVEDAPPQYADVRDLVLKARAGALASGMDYFEAPGLAGPAVAKERHTTFIGVSKIYESLALNLMIHHPVNYLRSATINSWLPFWITGAMFNPILEPGVAHWAVQLFTDSRVPSSLADAGLDALCLLGMAWAAVRFRRRQAGHVEWAVAGIFMIVFASSWAQALTEIGNSPRYGMPFRGLIIVGAAYGVSVALEWRGRKAEKTAAR
jgi:hypothetical protein